MFEVRKCTICGAKYTTTRPNAKYCGEECMEIGLKKRQIKNDALKAQRKAMELKLKSDRKNAIVNIAVEAKKAGMSYGQYVAKMRL